MMEEDFQEGHELQGSNTEVTDGVSVKDTDSPHEQELHRVVQDKHNQNPESLKQEWVQDQVQDKKKNKEQKQWDLDLPPYQLGVHLLGQSPAEDDPSAFDHHQLVSDEDLLQDDQNPEPSQSHLDRDQNQAEHQDHAGSHQDQQGQELMSAAANQDEAGESGGSVPALVITQAEELSDFAVLVQPPVSPAEPSEPQRPADMVFTDSSMSSGPDGGDMVCSDLLSLRSDSLSLASEPTVSRRSEEDDTRSVTASSFMSLFHRVQLDPLEKDWLRSSALGNMAAQRQLLTQEPSLVSKKDFITTALHWAAKQGCREAVDMMLLCGADVNVRSGYTALHLAAIHGHQHVVHTLINIHKAKTNIRDYHGKKADHYWTGSSDVFHRADSYAGGSVSHERQTQRYSLPSVRLSRSRSQGQLNLQFGPVPQSASHNVLDLQI